MIKKDVLPTTLISLLADKETVCAVTNNEHLIQRIESAQQKYPDKVVAYDSMGECRTFQLPLKWIDIRPPLLLSDFERSRRREWASVLRDRKYKKSSNRTNQKSAVGKYLP